MLTLSRHEEEAIIIQTPDGDEIRIVLHDLNKGSTKISIDAPKDYAIHREELLHDSIA